MTDMKLVLFVVGVLNVFEPCISLSIPSDQINYSWSQGGNTTARIPTTTTKNIEVEQDSKRYALSIFFKANWFRAAQYCRYRNMQLASILNEEEENNIETLLESAVFELGPVWISGTDQGEENNFFWMSNGAPLNYTKWVPNMPNGSKNENCLMLLNNGEGYGWDDHSCSTQLYFVCEYYSSNFTSKANVTPTYI